jgi:hypothetical protein
MSRSYILAMVLLSSFLVGFSAIEAPAPPEPGSPAAVDEYPVGNYFNFSGSPSVNNPAAAYSPKSGLYLVAYENAGVGISLVYVDSASGELSFVWDKSGSALGAYKPDVVYDTKFDRFLVVWDELVCKGEPIKCAHVIKGRLLYGEYKENNWFAGGEFTVASKHGEGKDLREAAAAYNESDNQFLVIFRHGTQNTETFPGLYGQMLGASASLPTVFAGENNPFEIRTDIAGWTIHNPDVAWSGNGGNFLAVWERDHKTETDNLNGGYLYDTYQGGLSQVYTNGIFNLAPLNYGNNPLTEDCRSPSIAFDPVQKNYVVVFDYFRSTGEREIHAQRLTDYDPGLAILVDYAFPIETETGEKLFHSEPVVDYSGYGGYMYVVYTSQIFSSQGANYWFVSERTLYNKDVSAAREIGTNKKNRVTGLPTVTGTDTGRALVVWQRDDGNHQWDVRGQRIDLFRGYIPLVLKE